MNIPVLVGERCTLAGVEADRDAETWLAGEDVEQLRWFDMSAADLDDVRRAMTQWRAAWDEPDGMRHWGIWADGVLAGGIELRQRDRTDDDAGWLNISYVVWPRFRRRGLALDAVRLVTGWAFDNLPAAVVRGIVHVDNVASRGVLTAAGFRDDGPATVDEAGESGPMQRFVLDRGPR